MYHVFFIYSSFGEHLGCFQVVDSLNNVAMDTVEQMSLWYECASLGYMSKSDVAGS